MGWGGIDMWSLSKPLCCLVLGISTKAMYFVIWEIQSIFKLFLQRSMRVVKKPSASVPFDHLRRVPPRELPGMKEPEMGGSSKRFLLGLDLSISDAETGGWSWIWAIVNSRTACASVRLCLKNRTKWNRTIKGLDIQASWQSAYLACTKALGPISSTTENLTC